MAGLDKILFWIFLALTFTGFGWSFFAFYRAFKSADRRDDPDGFRMFLWACGGLTGLIVAGMSIAYILWPLIVHYFLRV